MSKVVASEKAKKEAIAMSTDAVVVVALVAALVVVFIPVAVAVDSSEKGE